jgi:hypothetical protein
MYVTRRREVLEYINENFWGQMGSWRVWWDVCGRLNVIWTGKPSSG